MFDTRPDRSSEVVLAGRSNVGKSTLMAELTGHAVDTGQRPGVTRAPNHYDWVQEDFVLTDLPGFGFMSGVPDDVREEIKTDIVRYAEANADAMLAAVVVLDGNAALEIIDRHQDRGEVPHVLDMDTLFRDLDVPVVLAVNKMDKVDDRDAELDAIAERFGLHPPWQQWRDTIAPITAKRGAIDPLTDALGEQFRAADRHDLLGLF